ncbi:MAG: hypothetical protein KC589_10460, partial [Nanoarchaeota archaeon]|nr:hypothetical protein [Nanoarchaeota archaeon]
MKLKINSQFNIEDIIYQVFLLILIGVITYYIIFLLNPLIYLLSDSITIIKISLSVFIYYIIL